MLPTSAGVEPATSWSPVGRASNWATEASREENFMIKLHERMLLNLAVVEPVTFWSPVRCASKWAIEDSKYFLIPALIWSYVWHKLSVWARKSAVGLLAVTQGLSWAQWKVNPLTLVVLVQDMPCLCKKCSSLKKPTDLDLHSLPLSMWICIHNLV